MSNDKPNPEREQTDESLRLERAKADLIAEKLASIEENADAVIEKARARADAILALSRKRADQQPRVEESASTRAIETTKARKNEDNAIESERAIADEALRVERAAHAIARFEERDVTDEDLSHERERSDDAVSARDAFLGIVSHDLRNMLATMVGFAGMLAKGATSEPRTEQYDDQVVAYAKRIQRSGARMNRLIGDLVDVASIEAGMLGVRREPGDPALAVEEAVDTFQVQAGSSKVSLTTEIVTPIPKTSFDAARLLQVLTNLLSNALKFTPEGGEVTVHVECTGPDLRFDVRDNGIGIPTDKLEAVFERFLQVTEGDRRGMGLGLYISKCIVQGHGGRIWVDSSLGGGSTFSFTLPVEGASQAPHAA